MWKRVVKFSFILIVFLVIGFYYGYELVQYKKIGEYAALIDEINDINEEIIETNFEEEKIRYDTLILVENVYNKCNHKENKIIKVSEEIINMKEDEAKGYFENKGYSLLEFSPSEIKLLKEEDKICMEHFVIKFGNDNDSFLSVYKKDDNNELRLYRETDIAKEFLTNIDNENFEEGIDVYGKENVEKVLEDYE